MIYRSEHKGDYSRMDNAALRDTTLSDGARSLLFFMLSMSDDWNFSAKAIARAFDVNECTIVARLTELKMHGYADTRRLKDEKGRFSACVWDVYEVPKTHNGKKPHVEKTTYGKNHTRKSPHVEVSTRGKIQNLRTINIYKNNQDIKNNQGCKKDTAEKCQLGRYENVFLTNAEQEELCNRYSLETLVEYIDRLSGYIHDHPGKKYKNHKATIEKWINEDEGREAT